MLFDAIAIDVPSAIGSHSFSEAEIIAFARQFDPQPFHIDRERAAESHFGGLIASGWHVCAIWMRLTVDHARLRDGIAGISPGMDSILWQKPVRPGDSLDFVNAVTAKRRLASRPGWALLTTLATASNQNGEQTFAMTGKVMFPIED